MKREDFKNLDDSIALYVNSKPELNIDPQKLNSDIKKLISLDNAIANLVTTKNDFNKICLAHRIDENMCFSKEIKQKSAIASHTVANNQLDKIVDSKYKLFASHVSINSILKNQHPTELKSIGAPSASIFVGFCNGTDSCESKFQKIDNVDNFPLNIDDYLMFFYRDLGKRIVSMEATLQIYEERRCEFDAVEDFFKFSINNFSFENWIQDIKYQLIETKSLFMFFYSCINNKTPFYGKGSNFFTLKDIKTDIEGFAIGTSLRLLKEGFKDLGIVNNYMHYHFWIDENNKQRIQLLYPNKPYLDNFLKNYGNKEKFFLLFCMGILEPFPNLYFKENNYIKIKELMEQIYLEDIRNDAELNDVMIFMHHLKKMKIISY